MSPRHRIAAALLARNVLERLAAPARSVLALVDRLELRLCRLAVLRPGARVRLTGECCHVGSQNPGAVATVISYDEEADDYNVIVDGKVYTFSDGTPWADGHDSACPRGFDVIEWR
jgi:hypothetical protein